MRTADETAPAAQETLGRGADDLKTCEGCGARFARSDIRYRLTDQHWRKRRFCTQKCEGESRRIYPTPKERTCAREGCEERFTPTPAQVAKGFGKFCSRECDHEAHRKYERPDERVCSRPGCENVFTPTGSNVAYGWGKFCSKRCSALSTAAHEKRTGLIVACANCGREKWRYDSQLKDLNFCSRKCWNRYRWKHGIAISRDVVSLATGRARQLWLGRWEGRKWGHLGGRPRASVSPAQRELILKLNEQGWGRRAVASRLLLSERAVRNVLDNP